EVALSFDEIALVGEHHQGVADSRFAVRMILGAMPRDRRHLDKAPIVLLVQRPEDPALHRLEPVLEIRNGTVPDDVGGVLQKAGIDASMQGQLDPAGDERMGRDRGHRLGLHMGFAVAALPTLGPAPGTRRGRRGARFRRIPVGVRCAHSYSVSGLRLWVYSSTGTTRFSMM